MSLLRCLIEQASKEEEEWVRRCLDLPRTMSQAEQGKEDVATFVTTAAALAAAK